MLVTFHLRNSLEFRLAVKTTAPAYRITLPLKTIAAVKTWTGYVKRSSEFDCLKLASDDR